MAGIDKIHTNGADASENLMDSSITIVGSGEIATSGAVSTVTIGLTNGTDGQLLVGGGTAAVWADLTSSDSSITITAGANALDIKAGVLPINPQVAGYQLQLSDGQKLVTINDALVNNVVIPLNADEAFPVGTQILIQQLGAGQTTLLPIPGVTIQSAGGNTNLYAQYSMAALIKTDTDTWSAFGDLA